MASNVTLYWFVLPKWFMDMGGFEKDENTAEFVAWGRKAFELFGAPMMPPWLATFLNAPHYKRLQPHVPDPVTVPTCQLLIAHIIHNLKLLTKLTGVATWCLHPGRRQSLKTVGDCQ